MTAIVPSTAQVAVTGSPSGPRTVVVVAVPPAARAASTVPSPPSATTTVRTCAVGAHSITPALIASAACWPVSVPLNLSGATSTRGPTSVIDRAAAITARPGPRIADLREDEEAGVVPLELDPRSQRTE